MDAWQPIETAPKDGRYIWLGEPGHMRIGFWRSGAEHECRGTKGGGWKDMARAEVGSLDDLSFAPTCWMHMPPAPGAEPASTGRLPTASEMAPAIRSVVQAVDGMVRLPVREMSGGMEIPGELTPQVDAFIASGKPQRDSFPIATDGERSDGRLSWMPGA